jgi:hypothetical protein
MVKPASHYLDVLSDVAEVSQVPVGQGLSDAPSAIDPTVGGSGLEHGVFSRDLVSGNRY